MVQNIGINILIPLAVFFVFLVGGASYMASAAMKDVAERQSKKG